MQTTPKKNKILICDSTFSFYLQSVNINGAMIERIRAIFYSLEGISPFLDDISHSPKNELERILSNASSWPHENRAKVIIHGISHLQAFYYRFVIRDAIWNPLKHSFFDIIKISKPIVWIDETPYPPPKDIRKWIQ